MQIRASAPGKIILHGEHAVVHGAPALAAAINLRTFVTISVTPCEHSCTVRVLGSECRLPHSDLCHLSESYRQQNTDILRSDLVMDKLQRFVADHIESDRTEIVVSIVVFTYLFVAITSRHPSTSLLEQAFEIVIDSELPIGAGLGSSASFCASTACAIMFASTGKHFDDDDRETLNRYAFEAERIIHGNPSGIDNFVAVRGGAVLYRIGTTPERLPVPSEQRLIIVDTQISRSTKAMVERVHQFHRRHSDLATTLFEAIAQISMEAVGRLRSGQSTICPELIRVNQHLLNALNVGHEAVDRICVLAETNGMAAKLTGAGGGGCVICMVPGVSSTEQFMLQIREAGYRAFETTFSSNGFDAHYIDFSNG